MNENISNENTLPGEIIKRNLSRQVPVKLNSEELAQRGKAAGDKSAELEKLREESAERIKAEKERLREKEAELEKLLGTLRSGHEDRIMTCHERFHAGTVITVREDTMEVLGSPRPATPAERQIAIPDAGGGLLEQSSKAQAKDKAKDKQVGFPDDEAKPDAPFNPPRRARKGRKAE